MTLLGLSAGVARAFSRSTPLSLRRGRRTLVAASSSSSALRAGPPTQYILSYDYVPDVLEKRGPYREGHLQLARDLMAAGKCTAGGPVAPLADDDDDEASPTGAVFIFGDLQAARSFVDQDPYVSAGIVTSHSIQAWTVAVAKEGLF